MNEFKKGLKVALAVLVTIEALLSAPGIMIGLLSQAIDGEKGACSRYESIAERVNIGYIVGCEFFKHRF